MITRVEVPEELRGKGGVITKGMDDALLIFTMDEWNKLSDALDSLPLTKSKNARAVHRFFAVEAGQLDPEDTEDTFVDLSEALKEHINGDAPADGYNVTYGEGPFETICWKISKREWMLDSLIQRTFDDNSEEAYDALHEYLDNMKTRDDLEELKESISDYDIFELYRTLYYTFGDMLPSDEYEKYRRQFNDIFDVPEKLFPEKECDGAQEKGLQEEIKESEGFNGSSKERKGENADEESTEKNENILSVAELHMKVGRSVESLFAGMVTMFTGLLRLAKLIDEFNEELVEGDQDIKPLDTGIDLNIMMLEKGLKTAKDLSDYVIGAYRPDVPDEYLGDDWCPSLNPLDLNNAIEDRRADTSVYEKNYMERLSTFNKLILIWNDASLHYEQSLNLYTRAKFFLDTSKFQDGLSDIGEVLDKAYMSLQIELNIMQPIRATIHTMKTIKSQLNDLYEILFPELD